MKSIISVAEQITGASSMASDVSTLAGMILLEPHIDSQREPTPSYNVFIRSNNDADNLMLFNEDGTPLLYTPDDGRKERERKAKREEESRRKDQIDRSTASAQSLRAAGEVRSKEFVELFPGMIVPASTVSRREVEP
jgi:hypothetical protein